MDPDPDDHGDGQSPVDSSVTTSGDARGPEKGIALCLSGGGYRAMLFHAGSLRRLLDAGILPHLKRISSVSGGSITSAKLGMHWNALAASGFSPDRYDEWIVAPLRELASTTTDISAVLGGLLWFGTANERVQQAYRDHLYGAKTLQDLPSDDEGPRFVINASNVQTMALWRFMRPYMADYQVGRFMNPVVELAEAVAASSAFPPILSPMDLHPDPATFDAASAGPLAKPPFTNQVVLTDGGVYDNLGLETAWKRYQTVLVSDGGGKCDFEGKPARDWARHAERIFEITDNQVRSLRKRQIMDSIVAGDRRGAYWGIREDIAKVGGPAAMDFPFARSLPLAMLGTRLASIDPDSQTALLNWGYAICDAALTRFYSPFSKQQDGFTLAPRAAAFPY